MRTMTELEQMQAEAVTITCGGCGIVFAVPKRWQQARLEDHKNFWCPNGCCRHYAGETEAERLKRELKWQREMKDTYREQAEATRRSLAATKGVLTRTRNRIAQGKCPHCRAEFPDLAAHIQEQHAPESE